MPRMTRVIPTEGGSALVPADQLRSYLQLPEDADVDAEIEAAKQASLQQWELSLKPHLKRVGTILDTDSPTTVLNKAFEGYETMEQTEIDETITALQDRVSEDVMAQVIRAVDQQIIPSKWTPTEQGGLDTSRRSIQVPVENQLQVPESPRSENNTAEPTSQLERVLDQGNIPEHTSGAAHCTMECPRGPTLTYKQIRQEPQWWMSSRLHKVDG
eukprot:6377706-Amphidinium_carterae.1